MEFSYTILAEKTVDINFEDVYRMQRICFFSDENFNNKDIDLAKSLLCDDFGDNLEYYLHKLGFIDFDECENEYVSDIIWREYEKWLDDNYNPADFK